MSVLQGYVDRRVLLILQDGRCMVGNLAGFDARSNVILSDAVERTYSADAGVEEVPMGLYLVKGDNITLVGELDVAEEAKIQLDEIRAEPIPPIRHG